MKAGAIRLSSFVEGVNTISPEPGAKFLPIRAGHMRVLRLSIVDAFGQTLVIDTEDDSPVRAARLRTEGNNTEKLLQLTPRFAQPLRLRFDWTPTKNPDKTHPVTNPVCGWVIPNHLDQNLTIYNGSGAPLGAVQTILRLSAAGGTGGKSSDAKAFFWVPAPGTSHEPEHILNPHLRHFVLFLLELNADTGAAFWNLVDEALARTDPGEPEDDPALSLLMGQPLALARGELSLELAGLPATDQAKRATAKFDSHGFTKVKFPLHIGEGEKDTDGLIGYLMDGLDDPPKNSSTVFYAAAGFRGTSIPGAIEYGHSLAIDCETPLNLTVLMDPRAKVRAITGILPKKAESLPLRVSSAAKSTKEAFFQVAPLLGPKISEFDPQGNKIEPSVSMPKPSDDYGKWSWAYRPQVTMWKEVEQLQTTADQAGFATKPPEISEGWLKLRMNSLAILNFWVKEGTLSVQPNTNITLGWTLVGGKRVILSAIAAGQEPSVVESWNALSLPEERRVSVQATTSFVLVLEDDDGNRSETRLTVKVGR